MKILSFLLITIISITSAQDGTAIQDGNAIQDTFEQAFCMIGTIALPPPVGIRCQNLNEVFACAFGEVRCDGRGYCGTPPCHWR